MKMKVQILTVSALNRYVKATFDENKNLNGIYIKGEISNFVNHYKSGHMYFTLKDNNASIKCVMFSSHAKFLRFEPKNDMAVILGGSVSLYEAGGTYQFYATDMQPDGIGALSLAYEQLKEKLAKEGLFDTNRKKLLPKIPQRIAVLSSADGAALQDILNILSRRYPLGKVMIYPVTVQGEKASGEIAKMLEIVNNNNMDDVIILARGGGSLEDLWAFNEEKTVRAVASSRIPIISAVGHEVDYTLCDFAADVRAATPSEAAELVAVDITELKGQIAEQKYRLKQIMSTALSREIAEMKLKMETLKRHNPKNIVRDHSQNMMHKEDRLKLFYKISLDRKKEQLAARAQQMNTANPLRLLASGYTITKTSEDKKITDVKIGDTIKTITNDKKILSEVKSIEDFTV